MKKLIKSLLVGLGVAGMVASASAVTPTHFTARMLTGTYLVISNNMTYQPSISNFWYYSYMAGTNVLGGVTNSQGILNPLPVTDVPLYPDANIDVNPNLACQVIIGYTNVLFSPLNQSPVMYNTVWTNPAPIIGTTAASTNFVTITLTPVASSEFGVMDTTQGKSFSFSVNANAGTPICVTTNLPTSFCQGLYGVRATIQVGNSTASPGIIVNALNIVGWRP